MSDQQIEEMMLEATTEVISSGTISFTHQGRVQVAEGDYRDFWIKATIPLDYNLDLLRGQIRDLGQLVMEEIDHHTEKLDYRGGISQEVDY
jgi:hypothetical protein